MFMEKEPTIKDVLEAVNELSSNIDGRFSRVDERFEKIDDRFEKIDGRFEKIDREIGWIKSNMVTKDHFDDRLADLKGDLIVMMRKEDAKFVALLELLRRKEMISVPEAEAILSMEPFPKLFIK